MNEWPSPRMAREEGPRLSPTSVEVEAYLNELQDSDRWSPPRDERRYETHQFTPNWMRQRLNEPDPKDSLVVHKHSPRKLAAAARLLPHIRFLQTPEAVAASLQAT